MRKYRIAGYLFTCLITICFISVFIRNNADNSIKEEITKRVESEFRFNQLVKDYAILRSDRDSIHEQFEKYLLVVENQKKHPKIIVIKHELKADSISKLPPSEQYKLFTANINKYINNRDRYSLQRFKQ